VLVLERGMGRGRRWRALLGRCRRPVRVCCCASFVAPVVLKPLFNRFRR
jgi:hypothetical protein